MDYTKIEQAGNDTVISGIKHFNLPQILECGQCFRWANDGIGYTGIAHGRQLKLRLEDDKLIIKDVSLEEFNYIWRDYFDLSRDYGEIYEIYSTDESLAKAVDYSPGLRLLRQNPWEMLISFILSQNSNIPRIRKMISVLCGEFGQALPEGGHAFPTPEALACLSPGDLANAKTGYRAPYIIDAARNVANGKIDLLALKKSPTEEIKNTLMTIHGVGPKVCECVLLFGYGRVECCPMDVWMKRVMSTLYPEGFPDKFKPTAGIAQQYLFHYARMGQM